MVYRIDAQDRLIGFDAAFRRFAESAGAAGLPDEWLGRSLWDSCASPEINMVFRSLVERARSGKTVTVPSRCDSPGVVRFVEITLTPGDGGEVTIVSRLARSPYGQAEPDDVCVWCFREDACRDCASDRLEPARPAAA